jgi:flavin reductase (DIM6/NTAB) family NADH-FMN oxidoreductase RutF/DNA-binding FadR family transcriptional regulator
LTGATREQRRSLAPDEFRDVIGHFASGVTVISTRHEGAPYGTTASAVSSLSLEPPMLLICMNKQSSTGAAVAAAGRFAVNILSEDQPDDAMRFASKGDDKFHGVALSEGELGVPLLENALATCECRIVEEVTGGTHTVFLAEVVRASARPGAPLAYFRGQFGRLELAQDENAFRDLRARVMSRDIEVGVPLSLDDLAQRLDLPRGAVFHALTKLTSEGLVARDADAAFVVTPLTIEAVEQGLRARCAIELGVADTTVGRVAPERVAELRTLMEEGRPTDDDFDMREYVPRYGAFHEYMVGLADSPALVDAHRRVNAPMMITSVTGERAAREHADRQAAGGAWRHACELVDAYEAGDVDAARRTITRHIEQSIDFTRRYMDAAGGQI